MQITEEATRSFREENDIPSSGGLEEMVEEEERQKRGRTLTVSQVELIVRKVRSNYNLCGYYWHLTKVRIGRAQCAQDRWSCIRP
jgi:hypothetical protein